MNNHVLTIIILLVVLGMIMYRRVSGFVLTSNSIGTDIMISMMDLKEFSVWAPEQRDAYNSMLISKSNLIKAAVTARNFDEYNRIQGDIMRTAFMTPPQQPLCQPGTYSTTGRMPCTQCPLGQTSNVGATSCTSPLCKPGTYSPTGLEKCTPCPAGSYCPNTGMTSTLKCPNAPAGSTTCTSTTGPVIR